MNKEKKYSHDRYLEILKEAQIYNGTSHCYFCPQCRRYVPKSKSDDPCVFCGQTDWRLDNPLTQDIINTKALKQYMFETFRNTIEPFSQFDKLKWKNGHFFYKKDSAVYDLSDDRKLRVKDVEVWCVSNHGVGGYFLSMCVRWIRQFVHSDGHVTETTCLNFLTFKSPEIYPDSNDDKDDEFYFNLIFGALITNKCSIARVSFKALDEKDKEQTIYAYVETCCETMTLYENSLEGSVGYDHLLKSSFVDLMIALDDFSLIPRYWGYKE